ncbi:hypothetical protein D7U89_10910 [Stenotrophomonas maltophilia]|nr:hypothetical protein [Stenotrophomonas maltophilia]MBA0366886.1 hypothetical protein [Stenotrophomonas maltophilia]
MLQGIAWIHRGYGPRISLTKTGNEMGTEDEPAPDWLGGEGPWWLTGYTWPVQPGASWQPDHWWRYASGFREAGDRLLGTVLNDGRRDGLDILVMPTLFLYRHYIELALKAAERSIAQYLGEKPATGKKADHTLLERWERTFESLAKLPGGEALSFPEADRLIRELDQHDRQSFAFRYPESLKGEPHAQALPWVNYARLDEAMTHLKEAIDYLDGSISYANDCRP